ncbi:hypothetical protein ACFL3Q_02930 [Planctomycetota bacterium]
MHRTINPILWNSKLLASLARPYKRKRCGGHVPLDKILPDVWSAIEGREVFLTLIRTDWGRLVLLHLRFRPIIYVSDDAFVDPAINCKEVVFLGLVDRVDVALKALRQKR